MSTASDNTAKWAVRKFGGAGLPVGFEYFTTNPNTPAGSLPLLGGVYSRTLYKDLWSWVQEQAGYLIEESAWQEKSAANDGNVPFYSKGDGSTTFRVPSLNCWVKGANGIEEVGSYLSAGLPNVTGSYRRILSYFNTTLNGAFYDLHVNENRSEVITNGVVNQAQQIMFDASRCSSIYGNSDTVQPKSIVGMWLVKAYGTVTNAGNIDLKDVLDDVTYLGNRITLIGTVVPFAGNDIPIGYLPCNGGAISRTTYADLFAVIGTTYGSGNGSTTFNLPNFNNGSFLEGSDTAGTVKSAGLPNITGTITPVGGSNSHLWVSGEAGALYNANRVTAKALVATSETYPDLASALDFDASKSNAIYGESTTVQPKAVTVKFCIKY